MNREWFMLGAVGPALGDFVPYERPLILGGLGRTPDYAVWKAVLEIAVGNPAAATPLPGVVPTLRTLETTLQDLTAKVQAHDFNGVQSLGQQALDAVNGAMNDLATILQNFSQFSVLGQIANSLGPMSKPRIDDPLNLTPPNRWTGRDYLHWKHTGAFAARLVQDARASGDERFLAYALGWQTAFASLVCGSDFLASIVGSTYRTHWWRTRWIGNFVDTWTWGFYGRDQATSGPTDYPTWPSLCDVGLHRWIEVAPGQDPETIAADIVAD